MATVKIIVAISRMLREKNHRLGDVIAKLRALPAIPLDDTDYRGPTDDELAMVKAFLEPRPSENVPAQYAHDLAHIAWKAIVALLASPALPVLETKKEES